MSPFCLTWFANRSDEHKIELPIHLRTYFSLISLLISWRDPNNNKRYLAAEPDESFGVMRWTKVDKRAALIGWHLARNRLWIFRPHTGQHKISCVDTRWQKCGGTVHFPLCLLKLTISLSNNQAGKTTFRAKWPRKMHKQMNNTGILWTYKLLQCTELFSQWNAPPPSVYILR